MTEVESEVAPSKTRRQEGKRKSKRQEGNKEGKTYLAS